MKLICDNEVIMHIVYSPVLHEWTQDIEFDCQFMSLSDSKYNLNFFSYNSVWLIHSAKHCKDLG